MPDDDNALIMAPIIVVGKPMIVVAQIVCVTVANRIHNKSFDFGDISGESLSTIFDRTDEYNRLRNRIRAVEDRFAENLSRPDRYERIKYANNPLPGEIGSGSELWELAEAMKDGAP